MEEHKSIRISINVLLEEIISQYGIRILEQKRYIYAEIRKGMYGLPQYGRTENDYLKKIQNHMDITTNYTKKYCGSKNGDQSRFHW